MDQIKTGRFIQEIRKLKGLTQRELADLLGISDKTISKWETGNGLPEVGLMLPLCDKLGITVNELLSGERLEDEAVKSHADKNILDLMNNKKIEKIYLISEVVIIVMMFISTISLLLVASYVNNLDSWVRIVLIIMSLVILVLGIAGSCVLDKHAGAYRCPHCNDTFVPTMRAYVMATHTIRYRHLRCPHCGKKHWCRKVPLSKEDK